MPADRHAPRRIRQLCGLRRVALPDVVDSSRSHSTLAAFAAAAFAATAATASSSHVAPSFPAAHRCIHQYAARGKLRARDFPRRPIFAMLQQPLLQGRGGFEPWLRVLQKARASVCSLPPDRHAP